MGVAQPVPGVAKKSPHPDRMSGDIQLSTEVMCAGQVPCLGAGRSYTQSWLSRERKAAGSLSNVVTLAPSLGLRGFWPPRPLSRASLCCRAPPRGCPPNSVVTPQDSRGPRLSKRYRLAKVLVWSESLMFVGTQGGPDLRTVLIG